MRSQIGKQRVLRLHRFLLVSLFASSPYLDQISTMTNSKYGFRILTPKRLAAWKGDSSFQKDSTLHLLAPAFRPLQSSIFRHLSLIWIGENPGTG